MAQQRKCEYCQVSFEGRANQDFCSNAHKAKAFRSRREQEREQLENTREPYFFYVVSQSATYHSVRSLLAQDLNILYFVCDAIKKGTRLTAKWKVQALRDFLKEEITNCTFQRKRLQEKIDSQDFSDQFLQVMGKKLVELPRVFQRVATQMRRLLKQHAQLPPEMDIDVEADILFHIKMLKLLEKYRERWFVFRRIYLQDT